MSENNPEPTPTPTPDPTPTPEPTPVVADPHAGHAVYDTTLGRFVSEVYRGGKTNGKADADADAKRQRTATKGHTFTVKAV